MNTTQVLCALSAAAVLTAVTSIASADTVVAPNAQATALGNGQSFSPFEIVGTGYSRYQQVYTSALFGGFSASESITGIDLRAKQSLFGSFITGNLTISNVTITASTTQKNDVVGLDANLNNNPGSDATVVYSGPLTLSSSTGGTTNFGYVINFQTPFDYTKANGNLLLEFTIPVGGTVTSNGSLGFSQFDTVTDSFPSADGISSASSVDPTQPVGSNSTTGVVTEFIGSPAGAARTPEPASLSLLALGITALALRRRK